MAVEKVKAFFEDTGLKVIELPESSATVQLAAEALGTEPDEIAKTFNIPVLARIPIQEETSRAVDAGDVDSLDIPEIAGAAQVIEKLL